MDSHPHAPLPPPSAAPQLRCVLLCDLVASTRLVEVLGDIRAAELIREHDRLARELLQRHRGQEIDKTDGFLLLFERPIEAVRFALDYQRSLRALGERVGQTLRARVGVHVGEVLSWRNDAAAVAAGAKPVEVEGLAKAIAARLMALADPGQVLLSESAYSLALRARDELSDLGDVRWAEHGRYRLQGVARPLPVYEVGEAGPAPLAAPANKPKARRILPWYRWKPLYLLLALALVAAPIWYALKPTPAIAFAERDWIVVADVRNLTGDSELDRTLDPVFQVGLEQSRRINVFNQPLRKQALSRMRRTDLQVDRETAVQLAQREGLRLVVAPTISSASNGLRVTVELIDPATDVTLVSLFQPAGSATELLPAIDNLLADVRTELGESIELVDKQRQPLAKVTTANLDALRAYGLALDRMQEGRFEEAFDLFDHAIGLDAEFALALGRKGSLLYSLGRLGEGRTALLAAVALKDRLSQREQVYLDAQLQRFSSPADALRAWTLYANLYPDDAAGPNNIGLLNYMFFNDAAKAIEHLGRVVELNHPLANFSLHVMGHASLLAGSPESALGYFRQSLQRSPTPYSFGLIDGLVADGHYEEARSQLAALPTQSPALEIERSLRWLALEADQGLFEQALQRIRALRGTGERLSPVDEWRLASAAASIHALRGESQAACSELQAQDASLRAAFAAEREFFSDTRHALAYLAGQAARNGCARLAEAWFALQPDPLPEPADPVLYGLVWAAEHALRGRSRLSPPQAAERDLWEVLAVRADDPDPTISERARRSLLSGRGLALGQWTMQRLGQVSRIIDWNLQRARHAEALWQGGDKQEAQTLAADVLAHWGEQAPLALRERMSLAAAPGQARDGHQRPGASGPPQ